MSTQDPTEPPSLPQDQAPPPPSPQRQPAGLAVNRMLLLGLIIGLVVGAGGVGLAWGFSGGSGDNADADAVCGIVRRTPDPSANFRDISLEYVQRWSISDVAASLAKTNATYQPLADALREVTTTIRVLDLDKMREAIGKARSACDNL